MPHLSPIRLLSCKLLLCRHFAFFFRLENHSRVLNEYFTSSLYTPLLRNLPLLTILLLRLPFSDMHDLLHWNCLPHAKTYLHGRLRILVLATRSEAQSPSSLAGRDRIS